MSAKEMAEFLLILRSKVYVHISEDEYWEIWRISEKIIEMDRKIAELEKKIKE